MFNVVFFEGVIYMKKFIGTILMKDGRMYYIVKSELPSPNALSV